MAGLLSRARPLLHVVTVASLFYVGFVAYRNFGALGDLDIPGNALAATLGLALVYGLTLMMLAEVWHGMVSLSGMRPPPRALTWPAFTDTQLAKYLPGNVLHFVTRHLRLQQAGWTHGMLLRAFAMETVLLITGALLIAVLILSASGAGQGTELAMLWDGYGVLTQIGTATLAIGVIGTGVWVLGKPGRPALPTLLLSLALATVFFALSGTVFYLIAANLVPNPDPALIGFAAIAWIAGFVTPGAPGGLGPREAVLVLLAAPSMGEPAALIAIALYRCLTLLGDVVCFALGRAIFSRP